MADQLTEEQIEEYKEAFQLFDLGYPRSCMLGRYGLFGVYGSDGTDDEEPKPMTIPLQRVDMALSVVDTAAHVRLEQVFANTTDKPLEVSYSFPVLPSATVCGLTADLGGIRVQGRVLAKQADGQTDRQTERQRAETVGEANTRLRRAGDGLPGKRYQVILAALPSRTLPS